LTILQLTVRKSCKI